MAAVVLVAAACVPQVGSSSPFFGSGGLGLDGRSIADMTACAGGGGKVTVEVTGPYDTENPYLVEIFRGVGATDLLSSAFLHTYTDQAVSPSLAIGECFRVRITKPAGGQIDFFTYAVRWCTGTCTTSPTAPTVERFSADGGPFVDPAVVPLGWKVFDPNPDDVLTCRLDATDDGSWDVIVTPCPEEGARNVAAAIGDHTARFEVSDGTTTVATTVAYTVVAGPPAEPFDIQIRSAASDPIPPSVQAAFDAAAARWEAIVTRGLPDQFVALGAGACGVDPFGAVVDDLVVDVVVTPTPGYLALGGPCVYGSDDLPRFGSVQVDPGAVASLSPTRLQTLAEHELAHVLGFGIVWDFHRDLLQGEGSDQATFVGPRAVAEFSALGGVGAVPVDVSGHLTQWFFGKELMVPSIFEDSPISRVTIASLADVGYHVDLGQADPYVLPTPGSLLMADPGGGGTDAVR